MRIADKMALSQVTQNVGRNRSEMADLQNKAATQKRIIKPSDDPMSAVRVLGARTEERGSSQFIKNINGGRSFLEFTDQTLGELTDILIRAKELAVGQANDASGNAESRRVTASEIEQIYNQVVQIGNRKLGERFIFGGFKTQEMPFNLEGEYFGDDGDMKIQTQKESFVAINIPGNKVFLGQGLSGDGFSRARRDVPKDVEQLKIYKEEEAEKQRQKQEVDENFLDTRAPAALNTGMRKKGDPVTGSIGVSLFGSLRNLEISLRTNDKQGIQESLDILDQAVSQVVLARSEAGARISALNNTMDTLQKAVVDNKTTASQLEDADVFQTMSDITRTESSLKATLETSGKLIQPSLLDFLR